MKNYLIIETDFITIRENITNILLDNNLTKENIIKYDLYNDALDIVVEDLNTYGFLIENKVIICENAYFLSNDKVKSNIIQDETILEKYLINPNLSNILVLIYSKADDRKKITKLVKDKCILLDKKVRIEDKIRERLEDYKMSPITINYLISVCTNDNERILNELNKLKMYKYEEKEITIKDIDTIVIKSLEDNIFDLINSIIKKDINKCIDIYNKLLEKGEDPNKITIMTADQFRLIYNVKVLLKEGKSKDEIKNILVKPHPYSIKLAIDSSYQFDYDELLNNLSLLAELDIKTKTGKISNNLGFQIYLLNLGGM